MGIRLLNKLLKNVNTNGIYKKNLSELRGKVIVIDISIYMYRFLATNSLVENCYLMCSVFLEYDITVSPWFCILIICIYYSKCTTFPLTLN